MESKVKLFGHPVHQMLVVFPLGLLAGSVIFDLMHFSRAGGTASSVAYALIGAGLVAGLLAAPFGLIDWVSLPQGSRAKRVGAVHGLGNVVVLLLFALSFWGRSDQVSQPPTIAFVLSFAGAGLSLVTAWLGGEMVDRLGVGVSPHANVNARSSLDGPALPPAATREQPHVAR